MCTAVTLKTKDHYFGRTLDYEYSYTETVTVTPRNYPFKFRMADEMKTHYAIIGMAFVVDDYPLYYDATNEEGLSMAGLNFVGNAFYGEAIEGRDNIPSFELIPWILGQCKDISEVKNLLKKINITNTRFKEELPASSLHWIIADRDSAITVEATREGLKVYDNPVGVLTNNPPFDYQMLNLSNYMGLSREPAVNRLCDDSICDLKAYSRGMGAMGLPGDLSSASRFVKAAFTKLNSVSGDSEEESVSQFFHVLGSVEQQRGCVCMGDNQYEITIYTSCCNTDKGIYYYTTYGNSQITAIDMYKENIDGCELISYELVKGQRFNYMN